MKSRTSTADTQYAGTTYSRGWLKRLVRRMNRRSRWEKEACEALQTASYAAAKLRVEYERRSIEPRAEIDWLIAAEPNLKLLRRGPRHLDSPNVVLSDRP